MLSELNEEDVKFKDLSHYINLKGKWNKNLYGDTWRKFFSGRTHVGACMWLCEKLNPTSFEDFYLKYINSGTNDRNLGRIYRGRTVEELESIAIRWRDVCNDYETPLSEYYDAIVLHTIVETYVGKHYESKAISHLTEKGYDVMHGDDYEDEYMNIDLKVYKDGKLLTFLQVKPVSFIVSKRWHTKDDRKEVFEKHRCGKEKYPGIPYKYLLYDVKTDKWIYNKKEERNLFNYEDLVDVNGNSKISGYMLRKHETDGLSKN